jgi:hypothetical protein
MQKIVNINSVPVPEQLAMTNRVQEILEREWSATPDEDKDLFLLALHVSIYDLLVRKLESAIVAGMYDGAIQELEKMAPGASH